MTVHQYSLDNLRVFAIAARHLSFKHAAEELNVTPAAVGQRIRALEEQLEIVLFERLTRAVLLTAAGQTLYRHVLTALQEIEDGLAKVKPQNDNNRLVITTTPVFAERCLLHRLPSFNEQFPNCQVQVIADSNRSNLSAEGIDFAIRFGRGAYPRCISTELTQDVYLPVCDPETANELSQQTTKEFATPVNFVHCDWVTETGSAPSWQQWFDKFDLPRVRSASSTAGGHLSVSLESLAIHAALNKQGIALVHKIHVEDDLANGNLVAPFGIHKFLIPEFRYFLVEPEVRKPSKLATEFKRWLLAEFK
ncbi:MAG: LysR substrate-binding domain-containing protein [Pseudomonadota bacterium]